MEGNSVRWVAVGDTHGGKIHAGAEGKFWAFMDLWQPQVRIHLGDAFDLRWLRKSASDHEAAQGVQDDIDKGMEFLRRFRPGYFLWGNHDDRMRRASVEGNGCLRKVADDFIRRLDDTLAGAAQLPYNKRSGVLKINGLSFVHGYGHGLNAVRDCATVYGNVVMGHIHSVAEADTRRSDGARGWTAGCLCDLDMDYSKGNMETLRQCHGWAFGEFHENGGFTCQVRRLERDGFDPKETAISLSHCNRSDWLRAAPTATVSINSAKKAGSPARPSRGVSKKRSKRGRGNAGPRGRTGTGRGGKSRSTRR